MSDYAVYLGAVDWRHAHWWGALYPEDLPEDWRLAYYGTQFRCVYLERAAWAAVQPDVWVQWARDVPAGFRFLLEEAYPKAPPLAVLGEQGVAVTGRDDPRLLWFGARDDLRTLSSQIQARVSSEPFYLLSRDADPARLGQMQTLLELLGL